MLNVLGKHLVGVVFLHPTTTPQNTRCLRPTALMTSSAPDILMCVHGSPAAAGVTMYLNS
jgi:hypothetical protein